MSERVLQFTLVTAFHAQRGLPSGRNSIPRPLNRAETPIDAGQAAIDAVVYHADEARHLLRVRVRPLGSTHQAITSGALHL
jgi:hypothetical protein